MNKRILTLSVVSLILILSSCQKIKDLLAVKVDANFSVDLPINIQSPELKSSAMGTFSSTNTFNPLSNADLADYKSKIQGFSLTSLDGTVSDLSANVTLTNAVLKISTATNSTQWTFTNLSLTNGTTVTFDNANGQFAKINTILEEQTSITVEFSGTADKKDVTFKLTVLFVTVASVKI